MIELVLKGEYGWQEAILCDKKRFFQTKDKVKNDAG